MIKGLGTDILEISRFRKVLERHSEKLIKRLFTKEEKRYANKFKDHSQHLAGRFCAKEAVSKALGIGFGEHLSFQDICIQNDPHGKPLVILSKRVLQRFNNPQIEISISHCKEYATAIAIWF